MDFELLSNSNFCGPSYAKWDKMHPPISSNNFHSLVTLESLFADRALTVRRPKQQPPSLIFRLPAEMLAEIFMHATPDQSASSRFFPMHSHFVLCQVCGLWRAIALHTPSLWCRVVLNLGDRTTGLSAITSLARICFQRSRELPLALIVTFSIDSAESLPNLCMDLVLPVRHRIRHLELRLPAVFTESILKLPRESLKALRTIDISAIISGHPEEGPWFRAMSGLEGAPLLESVKLRFVHPQRRHRELLLPALRFNPHAARLPWHQLIDLRLEDVEIVSDQAVNLLEMATSLVHCSLHIWTIPPSISLDPVTNEPKVVSPKPVAILALRVLELVVSGEQGPHTTDFFDRLTLPSLRELSILYKVKQRLPCATLVAFLERSPLLRRLQLLLCSIELASLAAALTLPPEGADGGPGVLPHLCALALADRWVDEKPMMAWTAATKSLFEMVRSRKRRRSGVRLQELVFGSQASLSAQKTARLERWRAQGMRARAVKISPNHGQIWMAANHIRMFEFES